MASCPKAGACAARVSSLGLPAPKRLRRRRPCRTTRRSSSRSFGGAPAARRTASGRWSCWTSGCTRRSWVSSVESPFQLPSDPAVAESHHRAIPPTRWRADTGHEQDAGANANGPTGLRRTAGPADWLAFGDTPASRTTGRSGAGGAGSLRPTTCGSASAPGRGWWSSPRR